MSWGQCVRESCEDWHCFDLFPIPRSTNRESSAQNHCFLIAQIQKLVYCKEQALKTMLAIWMVKDTLRHFLSPLPITITFIPHEYHKRLDINTRLCVLFLTTHTPFSLVYFACQLLPIQFLAVKFWCLFSRMYSFIWNYLVERY